MYCPIIPYSSNPSIMCPRIISWGTVSLSVLAVAVILQALFSPVAHKSKTSRGHAWARLDLSLYIRQAHIPSLPSQPVCMPAGAGGALFFRRNLIEGPHNASCVVGRAQGFIMPAEVFAHSDFNIIDLTLETGDYSDSRGMWWGGWELDPLPSPGGMLSSARLLIGRWLKPGRFTMWSFGNNFLFFTSRYFPLLDTWKCNIYIYIWHDFSTQIGGSNLAEAP